MIGFITRCRMHSCIKELTKLSYKNHNDIITGEQFQTVCTSEKKRDALIALEKEECIRLFWIDGEHFPVGAARLNGMPLYLCERSELWLNRIVSFICGVMTSVLGGYLLGFL